MPTDATRTPERTLLRFLPGVLIVAGVALAILLPGRSGAAATMQVPIAAAFVAMGLFAAWAVWLARSSPRPGDPHYAAQLCDVLHALPIGALVIVEGRVREANAAACAQLGIDVAAVRAADPAGLFERNEDARDALSGLVIDRPMRLRRRDQAYDAHVSVHRIRLGGEDMLLLLLTDTTEAGHISARLDHQREELRTLARRLMTVQEDERASLSRELHDDIGQAITAIKLCASSLVHERDPVRRDVVNETAGEIALIADQTVAKLRDLSLLLRPPQLDVLGLEAALRWQAGTLFRGDSPALTLDVPPLPCRPPREVELACFRIAQEALTNTLRHAQAAHVVLRLSCTATHLLLDVEDDGLGLSPDRRDGLGLLTMRERAQQLGGTFEIRSAPGSTRIDVALPLEPETAD